jgi:hypothetical protein
MGVASLSCSPPDTDSARYHLETARDMMDKLRENSTDEVSRVHWSGSIFHTSERIVSLRFEREHNA